MIYFKKIVAKAKILGMLVPQFLLEKLFSFIFTNFGNTFVVDVKVPSDN